MDWHQNFILDAFKDIHLFKPVFQELLSAAGALAATSPNLVLAPYPFAVQTSSNN
jgi:hypothetical protein